MRIIHGKYGKRRLDLPKGLRARPTTDLAREGLFNILINRLYFEEIRVLDLFAGTGSISMEFASLGSSDITLVEKDRFHIQFIKKNLGILGIEGINIIQADVFKFLERNRSKYDLIFADPPYDMPGIIDLPLLAINHLRDDDSFFILEHGPSLVFQGHDGFRETRKYGKVHFSFFSI
jgi:16S rRNA (guanine(966)-N(2))-methyltransferase RsmD